MEHSKEIEWLKIDLTAENRKIVLDILRTSMFPVKCSTIVFMYTVIAPMWIT